MGNKSDVNKKTGLTVNAGDSITVAAQGIRVTGIVAVVNHWGERDGWDMEIDKANVSGGYSAWKQRYDGGRIAVLNGVELGEDELPKKPKYVVHAEEQRILINSAIGDENYIGFLRDDDERYILQERPWTNHPDDTYLTCVLAYYARKNQYVTWMYNKDYSSYAFGHYFETTEYAQALAHYEGRNK